MTGVEREFGARGEMHRVRAAHVGHLASAVDLDLVQLPVRDRREALRYGMAKTNPATFGSMGDWNWTADPARVHAPTLIIHGDEDAIPMPMVSEWVTALPNARILRLRETGHFPHAERPSIVFPAMETFLRGKWPKGAD